MIFLQFAKVKPSKTIKVTKENIGGNGVCIDWVHYSETAPNDSYENILLIFPGLTGDISDSYVMNIANEGLLNGYQVGIYQMRILNENVSIEPKDTGTFSLVHDISLAIDHITAKYSGKKIYAVGYSYGANQLVNYLGERNSQSRKIHAAVSISNPYELLVASKYSNETIYDRLLLHFLQKVYARISHSLEKDKRFKEKGDVIRSTDDIHEFDRYLTVVMFGYLHPTDYYKNISSGKNLRNVDIPLLCVHGMDDPITHANVIPYDDVKANSNLVLLTTDTGTHTCFLENDGWFRLRQWVVRPAIEFINASRDGIRNKDKSD